MKRICLLLAALTCSPAHAKKKINPDATAIPSEHKVNLKSSKVEFLAVGTPGFLKINGTGGKLEAHIIEVENKVTGELLVDLSMFDTGIDLRNKHMKEKYLEVSKYPKAELKFKNLDYSDGEHELVGILTIKGKDEPAHGKYTLSQGKLTGQLKIKLSDYPIGVPSYLGVSVAEDVEVNVEAEFE